MNRWAVLLLLLPARGWAAGSETPLRCSAEGILAAAAAHMGIVLRPEVPLPRVRGSGVTPLAEFQEAVAGQWGFRPPVFTNVYVVARNEIYLLDDAAYYRKMRRTPEDSLAHEYVHYLQVHYQGARLEDDAENLESQAVAVQTWFRERFLAGGPQGLCASGPSGATGVGPKSLAVPAARGYALGRYPEEDPMTRIAALAALLAPVAVQAAPFDMPATVSGWDSMVAVDAIDQLHQLAPSADARALILAAGKKQGNGGSETKGSGGRRPCSAWVPLDTRYAGAPMDRGQVAKVVAQACVAAGRCRAGQPIAAVSSRTLRELGLDRGRSGDVFWHSVIHHVEGHDQSHQASVQIPITRPEGSWTVDRLIEALASARPV